MDETRQYIIKEIHPEDYFYEFRDELIGKVLNVSYFRTSKAVGDGYMYCVGKFDEPLISGDVFIQDIVFKAVRLSEVLYAV